ncbi:MAG TPA: hypothetical protein VF657_17450 [Actinoplanes sp.]
MAGARLLAVGRQVAVRLAAAEGAEAAFLGGSIVVGLGNEHSDIDVYLVGAEMRESRRQLSSGGMRVDVQTLATQRLSDLVDRVLVDYPAPGAARVIDADLVVAVRLLTAEVVSDTGYLATLRQRLASRPLPLRRMVVSSWARTAYSAVEDVAGLAESAERLDLDAAILAGRRALLAAGKALAASCGDLHQGEKWVWHQLARSAPATFPLDDYRRLMHHDKPDPELISLVQTCLVVAMASGWCGVPLEQWPAWADEGGPLRRAAYVVPCSSDYGTVFVRPGGHVLSASAEALLIWGLCHGATVERLVAHAAALRPLARPWNGLDGARCGAVLRELAEASMITGAHDED